MSSKQFKLLEPFNLRDLKLKNRAVMATMTRARAGEPGGIAAFAKSSAAP